MGTKNPLIQWDLDNSYHQIKDIYTQWVGEELIVGIQITDHIFFK